MRENNMNHSHREEKLFQAIMNHPRIALGGGALVISGIIDLASHLDSTAIFLGLLLAGAIGWKAEDLAKGLVPGAGEEIGEAAERFAEALLAGHPTHEDQRAIAKLKRLFKIGQKDDSLPPSQKKQKRLSLEQITAQWLNDEITDTEFLELVGLIDSSEDGETVNGPERLGEDGESAVKSHPVSPSLSPTVSPEDEQAVVRAAFALIAEKGKVSREEIKEALGWNNKKHWIIKATCDKYDIAMPPGRK